MALGRLNCDVARFDDIQEIFVRDQVSKQRSIARHIIDGAITIDSIAEFQNMLKIFPDNPALFTAFADLLLQQGHRSEAAKWYLKASHLCFDTRAIAGALLCCARTQI